jgi:ureidoglycolate hydrolase
MVTAALRHKIPVRALTDDAFAPYGQVVSPHRVLGGQGAPTTYSPIGNPAEAQLVLGNGQPRIWIMQLPKVGISFAKIARHRRVTQCLGALHGKEWLLAVAPPGDLSDDGRPRLEDIVGFRIPGDRLIKLHVATWHAGPHFTYESCDFINLELMDTNERDFHAADLGVECVFDIGTERD